MNSSGTKLEKSLRLAFIDGILWAAQFMAVEHREESLAEDILRNSGYFRNELMNAQRRSQYENRKMRKIIRRATLHKFDKEKRDVDV